MFGPVALTAATNAGTDALISGLTTTASDMQGAIGQVVPIALGVAGTILVITIGWRLFRNFTRV